ncbi:MAG: hypothetical protein UU28_C0015G0010 [Parcubacteria group bacterium GW2011_GWD2_40_9]|nr:MAG: hypothetical protein UU28_C0015G0010 [Parcubacteria group bacterium GW2011_GWD2_40_9]
MDINFLKNISDFFTLQTKDNGSLICPKHKIEHSGKNVYSIIVDTVLFKILKDEKYFLRAKKRTLRTIKNLIQDPETGSWIFWPGRLDGRNMSNSVIDSGACSDALSFFYLECGNLLSNEEVNKIKDAVFKNCDSYLKDACVKKEVTNQRLWGGAGLATAYKIFKKKEWADALMASVEKSLKEVWNDGIVPYHSYHKEYKIYKGIYDTTPFYHSRHFVFIDYILECLGINAEQHKSLLLKISDVIIGMYGNNGIKNINFETKRWYFLSDYEIASNAYDIYALVRSYELSDNELYLRYAKESFLQLQKHQLSDGGIVDHFGKIDNFQCRIFWNANCAWLARLLLQNKDTIAKWSKDKKCNNEEFLWLYFECGDFFKFKNKNYTAILRGKKQPQSVMWGPRVGGGSLLGFYPNSKEENILVFKEWGSDDPLNFYIRVKNGNKLRLFLRENRKDLREALYFIFVELKALNLRTVLVRVKDFFVKVYKNYSEIASHFACDVATLVDKNKNRIIFDVVPSRRNGEHLDEVSLKRNYFFETDRIKVKEILLSKNKSIKKIIYNKNELIHNFSVKSDIPHKEIGKKIIFYGNTGQVEISFDLY